MARQHATRRGIRDNFSRLGWAWMGAARLGKARLGWARKGTATTLSGER